MAKAYCFRSSKKGLMVKILEGENKEEVHGMYSDLLSGNTDLFLLPLKAVIGPENGGCKVDASNPVSLMFLSSLKGEK